jgi:hypothetical protein
MLRNGSIGIVILGCVSAIGLFGGCSGNGGGSSGGGTVDLIAVSFVPSTPGPGTGPNGSISLPESYRDQALQFLFEAPLDDGVLGGFYPSGLAPTEFAGASAGGIPTPYYAFADQPAARQSLQLWSNATGLMVGSYIVGRHRDNPSIVILDPFVPGNNPLGLPASLGLNGGEEYVYVIPAGNAFRFGGRPATPIGPDPALLPLILTPGDPIAMPSVVFRTRTAFSPDIVPPAVLSIEPDGGQAGTPADPIPPTGSIRITFSKLVSLASIFLGENLVVRNTDVTNSSFPGGILVPGSVTPLTPGLSVDSVYLFTPAVDYGPGVAPGAGYTLEVRVGSFNDPTIAPITGIGGLPLSNSLVRTLTTAPCPTCVLSATVGSTFSDTLARDGTFVPTFGGMCRWNAATAPGVLTGRILTGSPAGNNPASLGTRVQVVVDPMPNTTNPAGLFSPFDSALANSGGQCQGIPTGCNLGINPNGGSHILHLYESTELLQTEDSLEQIEWSPVSGVTAPTVYPQYSIWCGVSNIAAPLGGGALQGLNSVYDTNYTLLPYQTGIPLQAGCTPISPPNPRKVPCGGPIPYTVPLLTTTFVPFPVLSPCFDFSTAAGQSGSGVNLIFEQNIEPGNQMPNFNRYRATSFTPVRRLLDGPLSQVQPGLCPFNHGGTFDIYKSRFTFVGLVAQCRSNWFDTGTANPTYLAFTVSPPVSTQPAGTESIWILEGTDASNPGPATNGVSAVYIDAAGTVHPAALTTIQNLRYFRFRVELRGNNQTNEVPSFSSAFMAYSF